MTRYLSIQGCRTQKRILFHCACVSYVDQHTIIRFVRCTPHVKTDLLQSQNRVHFKVGCWFLLQIYRGRWFPATKLNWHTHKCISLLIDQVIDAIDCQLNNPPHLTVDTLCGTNGINKIVNVIHPRGETVITTVKKNNITQFQNPRIKYSEWNWVNSFETLNVRLFQS